MDHPQRGLCGMTTATRKHLFAGRTIDRLNLLYHVCPVMDNDEWRLNLAEIRQRWHLFNGHRVLAIVQGDGLHDGRTVRKELGRTDCDWMEFDNDPELREVVSFLPLLKYVASASNQEASFFAHTKGTSSELGISGPRAWRDAMYRTLLDNIEVVRAALMTVPAVGTTKLTWPCGSTPPYPNRLQFGQWMFAGTFFWFRHGAIYTRPDWDNVIRDRYGAEAWLSGMFGPDECLTLMQPWPIEEYPSPSPYNPTLYAHRRV
jgi:hypothetical protein